jgi:FkbM family methyltransferase
MNFACYVSRNVIMVVKILPKQLYMIVFRVYHKILKMCIGNVHIARAYFGSLFVCDLDDILQRYIFYFGKWEPMISHVTEQLLRKGDVYVDVGANIGYYTLLASNCVGGSGKVVSIEASPTIYSLLSNNIARNRASNIRLVNVAASDRRNTLVIYAGERSNIGKTTTIEARGFRKECSVQALPIDEILSVDELHRVSLIKIDIEGAELPVLSHLIDNLSKYPHNISIIVEASVQDDPGEWARVYLRFQEAGFVAYEIENHYLFDWYLRYSNHSSVKLMKNLPNGQTDILFTRTALPAALRVWTELAP